MSKISEEMNFHNEAVVEFHDFPEDSLKVIKGILPKVCGFIPFDLRWLFIVYKSDPLEDAEDGIACVHYDDSYKQCCLYIFKEFFTQDARIQEETIMHEIAHIYLHKMSKISYDLLAIIEKNPLSNFMEKHIQDTEESTAQNIVALFKEMKNAPFK